MGVPLLACLAFFGEVAKVVIPPMITVAFGGVVIQKFFVSRANQASAIDALIDNLRTIQDLSVDYWSSDYDSSSDTTTAQLLKAELLALSADIDSFCKKYDEADRNALERFDMKLLSHCTGGGFETKARESSAEQMLYIVTDIANLRSKLLEMKL